MDTDFLQRGKLDFLVAPLLYFHFSLFHSFSFALVKVILYRFSFTVAWLQLPYINIITILLSMMHAAHKCQPLWSLKYCILQRTYYINRMCEET